MCPDSYLFTARGGRSCNQDSVGKLEAHGEAAFVVADGLGGHRKGELASQCVVETLLSPSRFPIGEDLSDWLREGMKQANTTLLELQAEHRCTMRSTAAALVMKGNRAVWANVGDSRVYYLHDRAIADVTEDHSVAFKKYKAGEISRAEIGTDADQSSLLRAVGSVDRSKPDIGCPDSECTEGDGFLLCSDGFWEYVLDEEILVEYLKASSAQEWGERLLLRAMERMRPGNDNLSVITVLLRF